MKQNSIQKKFNQFLSLLLLTIFLLVIALYIVFVLPPYRDSKIAQANMVSQVVKSCEDMFDEMDEVQNLIAYNSSLQSLLLSDNNTQKITFSNTVSEFINVLTDLNENIAYVSVSNQKGSEIIFYSHPKFSSQYFYNLSTDDSISNQYVYVPDKSSNNKENGYFLKTVTIFNISASAADYGDKLGTLKIAFSSISFNELFDSLEMTNKNVLVLLDEENHVCISKQINLLGTKFDPQTMTGELHKIEDTEFSLFMTTFVNSYTRIFQTLSWMLFLFLVLYILIILIAKSWITHTILQPVKEVVLRIQAAGNGGFFQKLVPYDNASFGIIIDTINNLIDTQHDLTHKIFLTQERLYEAEEIKRIATLNALKSCINPHFLYNTLGYIQSTAIRKKADDIAEMSSALINLFRYSIKDGDFCKIYQEIDIVMQYMSIMRYRFNGKFRLQIEINEYLYEKTIPKMIIQPLVENAITYGLEASENGGTITIRGWQEDGSILLSVSDSGKGVSPERLALLREHIENGGKSIPNSMGLVNVHERIKLHHGDGYGLELDEEVGGGFVVSIKLKDCGETGRGI